MNDNIVEKLIKKNTPYDSVILIPASTVFFLKLTNIKPDYFRSIYIQSAINVCIELL